MTTHKLTIERTLDLFHEAAANADGDTYFDLFASNGYFIGTDASERWSREEFERYARPHFSQGRGWRYTPRERHVMGTEGLDRIVWFDEILDSERFGTARGSGVLIQDDDEGWKIAQYHLTIPVPNDLMDSVVAMIRNKGNA
jgi:SnoaL-like domain